MSPLPQLSFTSMVQMADRRVRIPPNMATRQCEHYFLNDGPNGSCLPFNLLHITIYLYPYRLDFDELGIHIQGLAQICHHCLTLYYSQQVILKK